MPRTDARLFHAAPYALLRVAALCLALSSAAAQSESKPDPKTKPAEESKPERRRADNDVTKVVPLKFVPAHELAGVLSQTFRGAVSFAVDSRTNAIVASCDKETLARVETLIGELDVERAGPTTSTLTRFYSVEKAVHDGVNTNEIAQSVQRLLGRESTVSVVGFILAVRAPEADHARVKELVEAISSGGGENAAAARGVTITSWLLQSGRTSEPPDSGDKARNQAAPPLPDSLKSVAAGLAENGFRNAALLSTLTVHANLSGREFVVEGGLRDNTRVEVSGSAKPGAAPDAVDLRVSAKLESRRAAATESAPNGRPAASFFVQSTITARLGQYIVLAAAPNRTDDCDAVALVIRVTEAK